MKRFELITGELQQSGLQFHFRLAIARTVESVVGAPNDMAAFPSTVW